MGYLIEIALMVLLLMAGSDGQLQGSNCTLKHTGRAGVCTPFTNCQSAKEASFKGNLPQKCDLTDNDSELVCCVAASCPPLLEGLVNQLPIGSKAADYCIELAQKIHPCQETDSGWTRKSVCSALTPDLNLEYYLTRMTTMAEAPYYGQFGTGEIDDISWNANPVTLVSDQWVLCSAYYAYIRKIKFVGLGGTFESNTYTPDEIYGVAEQRMHMYFDGRYHAYYDIALLRLDRRVTFTPRIIPACLHTGTLLPDSALIEIGWIGSSDSTHFKTTMKKVSREECDKIFLPGLYEHFSGVRHDLEICSLPTQLNTSQNCASWYRGSPLTVDNSHRVACTHLLVGTKVSTAFSSSCTATYTRISKMVPWIESIVWPDKDVV